MGVVWRVALCAGQGGQGHLDWSDRVCDDSMEEEGVTPT